MRTLGKFMSKKNWLYSLWKFSLFAFDNFRQVLNLEIAIFSFDQSLTLWNTNKKMHRLPGIGSELVDVFFILIDIAIYFCWKIVNNNQNIFCVYSEKKQKLILAYYVALWWMAFLKSLLKLAFMYLLVRRMPKFIAWN